MLTSQAHLAVNLNKLLVCPKYVYTGQSVKFSFIDLPDEVLNLILSYLTQHELFQVLTVNYRIFKLVKAKLSKHLYVYHPSLYFVPKKVKDFNDSDYDIHNWFQKTVISTKNFLKLLDSYTFEPELTHSIYLLECSFSKLMLDRVAETFSKATLTSKAKISYCNQMFQCDFDEQDEDSILIEFGIRSKRPVWLPLYLEKGPLMKAGLDQAFEKTPFAHNRQSLSLFNTKWGKSFLFNHLQTLHIHSADVSANSSDLMDLGNLQELEVPSNVAVKIRLPKLRALKVIGAKNREGLFTLLNALQPNQLRYFSYNEPTHIDDKYLSWSVAIRDLKGQNGSLELVFFYCVDKTSLTLPHNDVFCSYSDSSMSAYRQNSLEFLKNTPLFPKLKTFGLLRYTYHVHSYDTIRELIPLYDNSSKV